MRFLIEIAAAVTGTVSFSLLFGVPTQYYPYCGFIGGVGWFVYSLLALKGCSAPVASLFATVMVILLSRSFAVREQCPGDDLSHIRDISPCAGSRALLDHLLYCDEQAGSGTADRLYLS